jgi:hypothetical protein
MALLLLAFVVASLWPLLRWHGAVRWVVVGACISSGLWGIALTVTVLSGAASQLAASAAESWTASELRRMRRHGWRLINGVRIRYSEDIDHVVIAPGGVLVIETKWSASYWLEDEFMRRSLTASLEQTARNRKVVVDHFRGHVPDEAVRGLLVLWSPSPSMALIPSDDDNLSVTNGAALRNWLEDHRKIAGASLDVGAVWEAFEKQARSRIEKDVNKPRPTLGQTLWKSIGIPLISALVAVYAFAFTHLASWPPLPFVESAAALLLGLLVFRSGRLRGAAIGWTAMNCGILLVLLALVVIHEV